MVYARWQDYTMMQGYLCKINQAVDRIVVPSHWYTLNVLNDKLQEFCVNVNSA